MDTISVIMPVYNVEKYLEKSILSVIEQTYRNLEIILVDDGSKDNSGNVCEEYAKKDKRIKVIHKENGGLSSARNAGMDVATGKYIMFLDSDDFYEKESCEVLYNEISKKDADYVIGNYIHVKQNGEKWPQPLFDREIYDNFKLSIKDYQKSFFVMNSVVWNKIFKREFLEKYKLRFVLGAIAEDAIFSTFCYVHTDNAYFINDIVYNYRQNETNSTISTNCSKTYFYEINKSYKAIHENFISTQNTGFYRYFYARITPYLLCKIIDTNSLESNEDLEEILKLLYWFFKQKKEYKVVILNQKLNSIIDNIINEKYDEAIEEIKKAKEYRKQLSDIEKEKMYAPTKKLYYEMQKYE